jgi:hypothetical protein
MQIGLLYVLMQLERVFNGELLHTALLNFPINALAIVYKRVGGVFTSFLCFKWVSLLVTSLQFSKKGAFNWLFRGAMLPVIFLLYCVLSDIFENLLPESSYDKVIGDYQSSFMVPIGFCFIFGIIALLLDPKLTFSDQEAAELKKRSLEYKQLLGIDVRFCKACEQPIVFRSLHIGMGGKLTTHIREMCS